MTNITRILLLFLLLFSSYMPMLKAASIRLQARDAAAWLPQQTVQGSISGFSAKRLTVHQDNNTFTVAVAANRSFTFSLVLHDGNNRIWVSVNDNGKRVSSDTITLQLGYHPAPVIRPFAVVRGNAATLHATVLSNPWQKLHYRWTGDTRNPTPANISNAGDSVAEVQVPTINGIYYFNLAITSGKDTARFQTYITRTGATLQAFNMDSSYSGWIEDAVIYEITPYAFVKNATYDDITAKLPEIKSIGVNTLWLQPVFKCDEDGGQGYGITDYFSLRDDLGSEDQLQHLVQTAKALGLRVLFDFVPNHTSIHHPYAEDCEAYGVTSHYYSFYQHEMNDGAMYSSQYHKDKNGFVYYFWNDLVNLNYANPEVQQWMIEACKYWVKKWDIDGYRFDAVWGVNARQPDWAKRLQTELKVIKPDALLLAEDKGSMTSTYTKGFDAAFDWTVDTGWVSQWSWQYDYSEKNNRLIFNFPVANKRGQLLRDALFRNGDSTHLRLRFIENNDLPRFIALLGKERTKMAAALTFAMPGIPLLYNGQEVGVTTTPLRKTPTFQSGQTIQSGDKDSLFPFYQKLTAIRAAHACLRSGAIANIPISPAAMAAFRRSNGKENIITVVNMDEAAAEAKLDLRSMLSNGANRFSLTDLVSGEVFSYTNVDVSKVALPMKSYSTRILLLDAAQKDWVVLQGK